MNHYTKIIIYVVSLLFILGGLAFIARPTPKKEAASILNNNQGKLTIVETSFDFGTISMAKGTVSHKFRVKNNSPEAVVINKIYTSCMCTTASLIKEGIEYGPYGMPGHGPIPKINQIINSGDEVEIGAVFDPAAHGPAGIGKIERVVYLENNTGDPIELYFTAEVTP